MKIRSCAECICTWNISWNSEYMTGLHHSATLSVAVLDGCMVDTHSCSAICPTCVSAQVAIQGGHIHLRTVWLLQSSHARTILAFLHWISVVNAATPPQSKEYRLLAQARITRGVGQQPAENNQVRCPRENYYVHLQEDGHQPLTMDPTSQLAIPNPDCASDTDAYLECDCVVIFSAFPSLNATIIDVSIFSSAWLILIIHLDSQYSWNWSDGTQWIHVGQKIGSFLSMLFGSQPVTKAPMFLSCPTLVW